MTTQEADFDVIVVGGGTAGSIAAIAAARSGAHTCLVEKSGHLGGTCFELANVTPFHNSRGEQIVRGLPQELIDCIVEHRGACQGGHLPNPAGIGGSFTPVDPEIMKLAQFEMATEAGVSLWLHSLLIDTEVEDSRGDRHSHSQQVGHPKAFRQDRHRRHRRRRYRGGAGAGFVQDQPEASLNATLLFRVGGVDTDLFIADARRSPQKFVLLADPYLREVKRLEVASIMRDVKDIYDCPYIYLANVVRDYIPTSDWAEWGITGEGKGEWGKLKPFGSRFCIMPLPHRRDIVTLNVTSITFDATNGAEN